MKKNLAVLSMLTLSTLLGGSTSSMATEVDLMDGEVTLNFGGAAGVRTQRANDSDGDSRIDRNQYIGVFDVSVGMMDDQLRVYLRAGTGDSFSDGYNSFSDSVNSDNEGSEFNVRNLVLIYDITDDLTVEAGSLRVLPGIGSDKTFLKASGYLTGFRGKAYILETGEITVTAANLGDYNDPNAFNRLENITDANFYQVRLEQQITDAIDSSIEYIKTSDDDYVRGVLRIDTNEMTNGIIDSIDIEHLESLDNSGFGGVSRVGVSKSVDLFGTGVIGDLEAGYQTKEEYVTLPVGSGISNGDSAYFRVSVPNVFKTDKTSTGFYVETSKGLGGGADDIYVEAGVQIRF